MSEVQYKMDPQLPLADMSRQQKLAPVYDMLPTMYAPLGGDELPG